MEYLSGMDVQYFIDTWKDVDLTERSACQSHFLDICDLIQHPKPAHVDKKGEWFTFQRSPEKIGGGDG